MGNGLRWIMIPAHLSVFLVTRAGNSVPAPAPKEGAKDGKSKIRSKCSNRGCRCSSSTHRKHVRGLDMEDGEAERLYFWSHLLPISALLPRQFVGWAQQYSAHNYSYDNNYDDTIRPSWGRGRKFQFKNYENHSTDSIY